MLIPGTNYIFPPFEGTKETADDILWRWKNAKQEMGFDEDP